MQDVEDIYALSPMQHGLLFDSVTAESSGMYVIQLEYFLTGALRREDFERAWNDTAKRHAVLRTSFHWDEMEKPLQVVHKNVEMKLAFEDCSALNEAEQTEKLEAFRKSDRDGGYDFEAAPLTRMSLFKVSGDGYRLLWSFHHILMEGWSASLILSEVLERYRAIRTGDALKLAEHRPYRDYVGWFQEQDPKHAEDFWRNELAGFQVPTRVGIDRSLTSLHSPVTEFDSIGIDLSETESSALAAFAKQHEITVNTLVQGAWAVLLSTYAGEQDVVFGAIVSGRSVPLEGVDTMIGLFVNLMPVRVQVGPDDALVPWLKSLQLSQVKQREFEYCSLVDIKGWSEIPPGLPLFESLLVFENWTGDLTVSDWDSDLKVSDVHGHHGAPGYPMTVIVAPGKQMMIGVSYDRTRFEKESVERLISNFRVLLTGLISDPQRTLGELPLLSTDERQRMVVDWNQTADDSASKDCVHQQFEAQASKTPDATAVVCGEESLSYRELDERSNQVAAQLRVVGANNGDYVGLFTERNLSMIVGMLGILKAGSAYLPLDPKHPKERLQYLLEDSKASILLTEAALKDKLPEIAASLKTVSIDGDAAVIAGCSSERVDSGANPQSVAYMIYTSGSTGKPKGVMIAHRSLANYVGHSIDMFGMQSSDRMLQFASISFDAAAEEIYPTLLSGATVVLRDDDMLGSVSTFLDTCGEWGITIIDFPTAYWHAIVEGLAESKVPDSVRLVILGGERANPEQLSDWYEHVGPNGPRLLNTYGPTEATIVATVAELRASDEPTRIVPIGGPVRNTQVYVLDPRGEPVPIGVPGELHIAGECLAVGYFERPELTAERFIANPFSDDPKARLYKSGDLVRYRSDGNLEYVGRRDSQVKFRGYRIELEEIESTLSQHERVHEAVVILREDEPGKQRLVAYVVPRILAAQPDPTANMLKEDLGEVLPAYMVPSAIVFLDSMPLTPHGKVDQRALPVPDRGRVERESGFIAPRNELETQLAEIWLGVLDVDRVGAHDNFFDLGGHSLLLMTVIAEIKKQIGVRVTPGELVLPTIGQLAKLCEERIKNPVAEKKAGGLMKKLTGWYKRS
ncbi:MAG: amino acid adenylation domain-containing protein [Planctomycetota bacterium]|jgi:amino acid adenylation domain-containing protein